MKQKLSGAIHDTFKLFGLGILKYNSLEKLRENETAIDDLLFLKSLEERVAGKAAHLLEKSKSQLRQDIFVLAESKFKRGGYFVEFGATNGVDLSNTHLLEKEFGWSGILGEPARCWHEDIKNNRTSNIDFDCVWSETGLSLNFTEADSAEYSTVSTFKSKDFHSNLRKGGSTYSVNTISLFDLLQRHNAPHDIDYLSIDTEGSEYEILENFDFNSYNISAITCEHNYTADRAKIFDLLTSFGYTRKFKHLSKFDDWYVR